MDLSTDLSRSKEPKVPVQISFHQVAYSATIANAIRKKAGQLENIFPRIISLKVVVEPLGKNHRQGNRYRVRINLMIPGHEIVAGNSPTLRSSHENAYVAIRDAFFAARRQLEDYVDLHFHGK